MGKITNVQQIGNYFQKDNIFLATISDVKQEETKDMLGSCVCVSKELLEILMTKTLISSEQIDIFYKDENGYTRFLDDGPEVFAGDNSDGKGFIKNVVSIWKYYKEDQVEEGKINDSFMAILPKVIEPLYDYNKDFNL